MELGIKDHRRCTTCGEWGWFNRPSLNHVCAPRWEARLYEPRFQEDWREVFAHDIEAAAAKFCEIYDQGGDYDILRRRSAEVEVRKYDTGKIVIVDIRADSVPQYYGRVRAEKTE